MCTSRTQGEHASCMRACCSRITTASAHHSCMQTRVSRSRTCLTLATVFARLGFSDHGCVRLLQPALHYPGSPGAQGAQGCLHVLHGCAYMVYIGVPTCSTRVRPRLCAGSLEWVEHHRILIYMDRVPDLTPLARSGLCACPTLLLVPDAKHTLPWNAHVLTFGCTSRLAQD